jgi:hypothetical protein
MARIIITQMANSTGIARCILFTGLSHSVLMHPFVHGEPVLTAQAFYYLDELECIAKIRLEDENEALNEDEIQYLLDNYLFEFSKAYPGMSITPKVEAAKFWRNDYREFYILVDQRNSQSLTIDASNDPDVRSIKTEDEDDAAHVDNWDIGRNYTKDCLETYINALASILDKRVIVDIAPNDERDGYRGKLRVIRTSANLIDYWQATALEDISIRSIASSTSKIPLPVSACRYATDSLTLERVVATKQHTPILLSHYFSGLKESNPLKAFAGFYNVLEYYFEDAPLLLGRTAPNERRQLENVICLVTTSDEIIRFLNGLEPEVRQTALANIPTSSGAIIGGLDIASDIERNLARWLYDIRCAVIHSKRTRGGVPPPSFEPYSSAAHVLRTIIPIIQWLAVQCIEKDYALRET